jgi:hypothetical protein
MKYLTYLAAIGLVEAKIGIVIDDQKIQGTVMKVAGAVQTEAMRPESQAVAQALSQELEKAAIKVDLSMSKLITPILGKAQREVDTFFYNEDCDTNGFYQCLADEGRL